MTMWNNPASTNKELEQAKLERLRNKIIQVKLHFNYEEVRESVPNAGYTTIFRWTPKHGSGAVVSSNNLETATEMALWQIENSRWYQE